MSSGEAMFFSRQSGESYLWITVPMMVTTEVPQTAMRITGFDFGLIARNQVIPIVLSG
jgi:hypothetical protein